MTLPNRDKDFLHYKAITRDLIDACGGLVRAGAVASVSKSQVSRWQNVGDDTLISGFHACKLEADCGLPLITQLMAQHNGRSLADGDEASGAGSCIASAFGDLMQAAAVMMAEGVRAGADHHYDGGEIEMMSRAAAEVARLSTALGQVLADAKARPSLRAV